MSQTLHELFTDGGYDPEAGIAWDGQADPTTNEEARDYHGRWTKVGKEEHLAAAAAEREVASMVNGRVASLEDGKYTPRDVEAGKHQIEVKALLKGEKQSISVHPDALNRKVQFMASCHGCVYHTVAIDERATYGGGAHADSYSGQRLYYKRGCDRYSLSQMEPVRSAAHLRSLIRARDEDLPDRARGALPSGRAAAELRVAAEAAHASRLAKDRARKERLRDGG